MQLQQGIATVIAYSASKICLIKQLVDKIDVNTILLKALYLFKYRVVDSIF